MTLLRTVLVDDMQDIRHLLRTVLTRDGRFEIVGEAGNGRDALALVEDLHPDLVVLDIDMPQLDGIATLPRLRAIAPATRIVMLSGYPASEMERPALDGGAVGYIEKRADIRGMADQLHTLATLLGTVQQILDESYAADTSSVGKARHALRAALEADANPTVLDVVELLTSELVTNAVKHAHSAARVTAAVASGRLRVSVLDDGPGAPVLRTTDADSESGRGLELVELLSDTWGVHHNEDGKAVWFEVPL